MTWAAFLLLCLLSASLLYRAGLRQRLRLQSALDEARDGRDALARATRLAGRDLRDTALRLTGEAGAMAAATQAPPVAAARLSAAALRCRTLADDLGSVEGPSTGARLEDQRVDLLGCVEEAVAAIVATLLPGRRIFCLPQRRVDVTADRRAVRYIVGRVLTEAALSSREGDSIAVMLDAQDGGIVLSVADEGSGVLGADADPATEAGSDRDSRGLGAGLALARALMEAHGGRLDVIAAPGTGTRASLIFPPDRCPE